MWKNKTNEGRVVYDRKKHPFRITDIIRIWNTLSGEPTTFGEARDQADGVSIVIERMLEWIVSRSDKEFMCTILQRIQLAVSRALEYCPKSTLNNNRPSSDGEFGGGGTTRDF